MKERKATIAPILTPNTNHELNFETSFDQKSGGGLNHNQIPGGYSTNNVSHIDHQYPVGGLDSRSSPARTVIMNLGNTSPRRRNFAEISTINASSERTQERSLMQDIIQLKNGVNMSQFNNNFGQTQHLSSAGRDLLIDQQLSPNDRSMEPLLSFPAETNNEAYATKLQPGKRVSKGSKLTSLVNRK